MSSTKTNRELLASIKTYNKEAREKKAKSEGFSSASDMILWLEGAIANGKGNQTYIKPVNGGTTPPKSKPTAPGKKPVAKPVVKTTTKTSKKSSGPITIHIIDVLDNSGSMSGGKATAAYKGINIGVGALKSDPTEGIDYTYTLCDFADDIIFRHSVTKPISSVKEYKGNTRGSTALYDAIGMSIDLVEPSKKPTDKVLVNIYTDGQENASRRFTADKIARAIKVLSEVGWTFTFIGTAHDVAYAQNNLHFDSSNTLVHDNTEKGLEKAFTQNTLSRGAYSSKVSAGEDVSKGFYKDID